MYLFLTHNGKFRTYFLFFWFCSFVSTHIDILKLRAEASWNCISQTFLHQGCVHNFTCIPLFISRIHYKNNPHFCVLLTQGSILQSLREGGPTLYKVVHAILSNIRTTTWGLDYYQKTLTMQKPLCSCGWCIYNHHNKFKVMNISCTHSNYHWLKLTYLISVWNISAPYLAQWFQKIIEIV